MMFTDLVNSTEVLKQAGDERAQQIFKAHHKLLSEAVTAYGGHEVKWLGDGLMVAFSSAADAVRCAIAMQQRAHRSIAGVRLRIRAGLHVGEALRDEADYFGTPVVVAQRLCTNAASGQILTSSLVAGLLAGRQSFSFREIGTINLKGLGPTAACEVVYESDEPAALLHHTPFVGRAPELTRLAQKLAETREGRGGLVMLVGEPGIGKTRILEEFAESARHSGALVIWGRCYEGEWAPPYGPFAEGLSEYARVADVGPLRNDLGFGAPALARLVPVLRERLPDISEPAQLQPEEERFRLLDAVSQFLIAVSVRAPLLLVLDDLHWSDRGTVAMLRHVARFVARNRILITGAYRDVEIDRQHPLADALGALRRETNYERLVLKGLDAGEIGQLIETIADQDVPEALVKTISSETEGNPFFVREVLMHLVEEGKIFHEAGRWTTQLTIEEMGIPEGIRQVIGRRLSRLTADANALLAAASAFNGVFHLPIAASVAGLSETTALSAIDQTLGAQLIRPGAEPDSYAFTHALIRHTLYTELSSSRQVRLHRKIAQAMERVWGARATEHCAELAFHYARSAALPGAEHGADHAIAAADRAEAMYALDEVVSFLRIALELLLPNDLRRPRLLGRLGLVLAWTLNFEDGVRIGREAAAAIAACESQKAAADYLAGAARAMHHGGFVRGAWELAKDGLRYAGERRDLTWAILTNFDLGREGSETSEYPNLRAHERRYLEWREFLKKIPAEQLERHDLDPEFSSREEIVSNPKPLPSALFLCGGEFRRSLEIWRNAASAGEREGRIGMALVSWAVLARCSNALGDFAASQAAYERASALSRRFSAPSVQLFNLLTARFEMLLAVDDGWEEFRTRNANLTEQTPVEYRSDLIGIQVASAYIFARLEQPKTAAHFLKGVPGAMAATQFASCYSTLSCDAASSLWLLGISDYCEVVERDIRERVVAPDFRYPMRDGRLSLARLCALQGRYGEAVEWFAKSRVVLSEQCARPLRAVADYDEALMYVRRGASGDNERARPLLDAAIAQFRSMGMAGWLRRAENMAQ